MTSNLKVNGPGLTAQKSLPKDLTNGGATANPTITTEMKIVERSCTTAGYGTICPANLWVTLFAKFQSKLSNLNLKSQKMKK
jgi:hypothetical protein